MNLMALANSQAGIRLALTLGRLLPLPTGIALASRLAERVAVDLDNPQVQAVRANQQGLEQGRLSEAELTQRTRAVFHNAARGQFELFHYLGNPQAMRRLIAPDTAILEMIRLTQAGEQGIVFACPHTGNFELAGYALTLLGLRVQILAHPGQRGDYQAKNRLRQQAGMEITPISLETLRLAIQRLQSGGSTLTGLDWPVGEAKFRPRFCGRPSLLPTGHIRMALKACAPVVVVACLRRPDGIYNLAASDPIPMQPAADPAEAILQNTEAVLAAAEPYIRQDPEQWLMFYPVWDS
jgi:lauroyl/myristoyl acyltransferase